MARLQLIGTAAAVGTILAWAPAAWGQAAPASGSAADTGEIIVTAQKREERQRDVPISMAALGPADLAKRGIGDITDLRGQVPNLQIAPHPNSANTARVFIRGIGANDDQMTLDPSVAVYVDGVYVARSQALTADSAEIERIEVLRGPQGTLYGRNSTGGTVNFITRAPELGQFSLKQTLTVGDYAAFRAKTSANVPLGTIAALQLGYLRDQKDGYVANLGTGVPRFGDKRRDAYRAALRVVPTAGVDLRYTYDRSEIRDTPAFLARTGLYPVVAPRPTAGSPYVRDLQRNRVNVEGHSLIGSWALSDQLTVKSITGYRVMNNRTYMDYHTGVFSQSPLQIATFDQHHEQTSEEVQLIGSAPNLDYIVGGYYFHEDGRSFDTGKLATSQTDRTVSIKNTAYALFGQATWKPSFLPDVALTAGVRYSHDERRATLDYVTRNNAGQVTFTSPSGLGNRAFDNVSPYVSLAYKPTENVNLYAKWQKGYKAGGFNVRASTVARFSQGFNPENISVFEGGAKVDLLDHALRINAAAFYGKYRDIQVNIQSDPNNVTITDLLNAGRATISGVEWDMTLRPAPGLTATVNYGHLNAHYDSIVNAAGGDISTVVAFVEAPKNTVTASLEYAFPRLAIGQLTAFVDASMQDKRYGTALNKAYVMPAYTLVNARLSLSDIAVAGGRFSVALYGSNLTDATYYTAYFNGGVPTAIYGSPRSYGVELKAEF